MTDSLIVGLDAGGTKTAAIGAVGDDTFRLSGPGAQALRDGPEAAAACVVALVDQARQQTSAPLAAVAVGLAGAGREDTRAAIADALRPHVDGAAMEIVHDGEIAYRAAWGDESGALLIVGTGSFVFARTDDGETVRAGGWGSVLGDDGSGTALGRAALRTILATFDGGPPSALPDLAAEQHDLESAADILAAVYSQHQPLASFAPLLLRAIEAGDWAAETALRAEVNALAKQAGWIATRLGNRLQHRLRYTGGLSSEPTFRDALDDALGRHLPGWTVGKCEAEPVDGALSLARSLVR